MTSTITEKFNTLDVDFRPRVAVALGSGGIKPLAALALFEFLHKANILIDLIVGCSGGSVLCAGMGVGYQPAQIPELISQTLGGNVFGKVNYRSVLGIAGRWLGGFDKSSGILDPSALRQSFRRLYGDLRLEDLRPRTLLQATDVETGEGVVLSRGLVADAVYASSAFFPVLPPVRIDGRWLADGVYSAPVPVLEAAKRNMDVIIALDFKERPTAEAKGFADCFYRYIDSTMRSLTRSQMMLAIDMREHEIVIINVEFDHTISVRDTHEVPNILAAGREAVERSKGAILSAVKSIARRKRLASEH